LDDRKAFNCRKTVPVVPKGSLLEKWRRKPRGTARAGPPAKWLLKERWWWCSGEYDL